MPVQQGKPVFESFDNMNPKVSVKDNFDDLLIPADHPSRSPNDTFCAAATSPLVARC